MANNFQQNDPVQAFIGKVIGGVVVRLLLIIILPIVLGIAIPKIAAKMSFILPRWFMPVLIVLTILTTIILLIRFIVKQYFLLKNGFQNLEQTLGQTLTQPPIDYNMMNNRGYNNSGYPNGYDQHPYNQQGYNQQGYNQQGYGQYPQSSGYDNSYQGQQNYPPQF